MACLDPALAEELEATAMRLKMGVLIETHDEEDVEKALRLKSPLIGINNRDLKTFETSLQTTARLAAIIPRDRFLVSESGIALNADLQTLSGFGAKAFLVGESLMRDEDVAAATRRLLSTSGAA
jgi:indole-3-glycerol phosphate synthase